MMKNRFTILLLMVWAVALLAAAPLAAQDANLTADCVTAFDPDTDYFPHKTQADYAVGWQVTYFNHYKVLDVYTPWPGAGPDDAFQYVLVQCGTPAPEGYDDALVIEIPAGEIVSMSTSYLPHIVDLGLVDRLVGLDSFGLLYASSPAVLELVEAGSLADVGTGSNVNVEVMLDLDPGLVLTYGSGSPEFDAHPVLLDVGVPVVLAADFVETVPLGMAEWVKFVALFYNLEAEANALFDARAAEYEALAALARDVPDAEKPQVLWNSYTSFGDAWFIPGGRSYTAQLIRDAGAAAVLSDDPQAAESSSGVPFSFEAVYEAGLNADFWVPVIFGVNTLDELLAQDARYADLAPTQNGTVYDISARLNPNGGNDYFETGAANPQLILADLISLFHPDLLPGHTLYFFRPLD
jgi:iron complex transport system substrate-binding protein